MRLKRRGVFLLLGLVAAWSASAADWPQLQANAARTGITSDSIAPPIRARWIWVGPTLTLRNRDSEPGWPHDLTSRDGYSYPMPTSVGFTIAETVQPVVATGRVFVGTQEGSVHAIAAFDGATLWSAALPGGTAATAAVDGSTVVFVSLTGIVRGYRTTDGAVLWEFDSGRSITGAPLVAGGRVYVADHGGWVTALVSATGQVVWRQRLTAPVLGGMAADLDTLYVGSEDMRVHALRLSDGTVRATARVRGQSFRTLWPVVHGPFVWVSSVTTPIIGSEYVMESLMDDSPTSTVEEANIARWLTGDTNGGRWPDAGEDWQRLFALRRTDLGSSFTVLAGPADGCGYPAHPPVVAPTGHILTYFKTRHPTFTTVGAFGTNYSIDICAVNPVTGGRIQINNGTLAGMWMWETDNLYAMTVCGPWLWLRQNFRGTQMVNLFTSAHRFVSTEIRTFDGGYMPWDIVYRDTAPQITTGQTPLLGRVGVVVVQNTGYMTENFCVTAMEHMP